ETRRLPNECAVLLSFPIAFELLREPQHQRERQFFVIVVVELAEVSERFRPVICRNRCQRLPARRHVPTHPFRQLPPATGGSANGSEQRAALTGRLKLRLGDLVLLRMIESVTTRVLTERFELVVQFLRLRWRLDIDERLLSSRQLNEFA